MDHSQEQYVLLLLKEGREEGIDLLFRHYYKDLALKINQLLADIHASEDLAQEIFLEIWNKRQSIDIVQSFRAYIMRAGTNRAINYLKAKKLSFSEIDLDRDDQQMDAQDEDELAQKEIYFENLRDSIASLPEKCRVVFSLSRYEKMTYSEIAAQLNISIKTVENHISKALRILKENAKYLKVS
ncbi:MAG: RNA polymerase sigma-70 factor [Saprospiraceae bacterium]|nr:RNA polymerase sigma-70 factor [Candidatus Vicinibacter affinis]